MNLQEMVEIYINQGYDDILASAKVCQDIILYKISKSNLNKNITLKGGLVIHRLSNNIRRATNDIDLDFIRYSLDDKSIKSFIETLNTIEDTYSININSDIVPLHHQDYKGKRVGLIIKDKQGNELETKLDIGVNADLNIKQNELIFDFDPIGDSAKLLVNTPEQIFSEKMKSLMIHGINSTRYKDIYDFYYLISSSLLNEDKLKKYIQKLIIDDYSVNINNFTELFQYFSEITNDDLYLDHLKNSKIKWIEGDINIILKGICDFLRKLI